MAKKRVLYAKDYGVNAGSAKVPYKKWVAFLDDVQAKGAVGKLAGSYNLSGYKPYKIRGDLELQGTKGSEPKLNGGPNGGSLFALKQGSFVFKHIHTENLTLIDSTDSGSDGVKKDDPDYGTLMTGQVKRLEIVNWHYKNGRQRAVAILRVTKNHNGNTVPIGKKFIQKLILKNIDGTRGLGGICCVVPIEDVDIAGITIRNIDVPNHRKYYMKKTGAPEKMMNTGYGDGLYLGENRLAAAKISKGGNIRAVKILGSTDHRTSRKITDPDNLASLDGVRVMLRKIKMGRITVANIKSKIQSDTTGAYFKAENSTIAALTVTNCGGHEASVVIKGGASKQQTPRGDNLTITKLVIKGDGQRRSALYLGADDVDIKTLIVQKMGGLLKNPSDGRKPFDGYGTLIFSEGTHAMENLSLGTVKILNCTCYSPSEFPAIFLQAYKNILITDLLVRNLRWVGASPSKPPTYLLGVYSNKDIDNLKITNYRVPKPHDGKSWALLAKKRGKGKTGNIRVDALDLAAGVNDIKVVGWPAGNISLPAPASGIATS